MIKKIVFITILSLSIAYAKVEVTVSIEPQKTFVEKIGQNLVDVNVMVPSNASPATYEPKPSQIKKLIKSDIYFYIGVPFEKAWLPRFKEQAKNTAFINSTELIAKLPMDAHHHHEDKEHNEDKKKHDKDKPKRLDPHVWLSPILVATQAQNILNALIKVDPKNSAIYAKNYKKFLDEIANTDAKIRDILKDKAGANFMVFHPSWGYFAKSYNLNQIPIEIEGKEPSGKDIVELIKDAKELKITTVFIQPQFPKKAANIVAKELSSGLKLKDGDSSVQIADPLSANWSQNLIDMAEKISKGTK